LNSLASGIFFKPKLALAVNHLVKCVRPFHAIDPFYTYIAIA
jgi:hypothetical protein